MMYQVRTLVALIALATLTESRFYDKREAPLEICNTVSTDNKVQCFCIRDRLDKVVRNADCYLSNADVKETDSSWDTFETIRTVNKITFSAAKGISLKYVPTNGIKHLKDTERIDIKYGEIREVKQYAFANLSQVDQIALSDNKIEILRKYAFANLSVLTEIILDRNLIVEINRDVFYNLPSLNKLFMSTNNITTIHDKAFQHLNSLQELDLDKNNIFSLNSETFSGLRNLQRLQLGANSLEVIGDNTFLPLMNLKYLDLQDNKIQMLDEKAFRGLTKLQSLSLNRNKLRIIDNVKVFEGLHSLRSLSLKDNQLVELKAELFAPIIRNFHGPSSMIDFEDNQFPCDCRLEWLVSLRNKTENENLKLALDNLKCLPDEQLSETWKKTVETEQKSTTEEDAAPAGPQDDYEYYDDTQLNGKLFYIDIRHLLNCDPSSARKSETPTVNKIAPEVKNVAKKVEPPPKETKYISSPKYKSENIKNRGILDLALEETTVKEMDQTREVKNMQPSKDVQQKHTTSRVATVSPKPFKNTNYVDKEMASDEAASDKFLANQMKQEYTKEESKYKNSAFSSSNACILLFIPLLINLLVV